MNFSHATSSDHSTLGVLERYRHYLPISDQTPVISLQEGSTPLIFLPELSQFVEASVYVKYEGLNPTCSFKDRGMTLAISKAAEQGSQLVVCASTGNTSAAAAAYAARARMKCAVILPAGKIAKGKLVQAYLYGAMVIGVRGNFDQALDLVRQLGEREGITVVNSVNPDRIEGQKTAAFEVIEALGEAPDYHFLPVGNAGNITAYWKGYRQFFELGKATRLPVMWGVQAAGAAPFLQGSFIKHPETVATAIRIGAPASWQGALAAAKDSAGGFSMVTDEEILAAQQWLASHEGVFAEPASVAPIAALLVAFHPHFAAKERREAFLKNSSSLIKITAQQKIVVTLTGHGLKDPDTASRSIPEMSEVEPTLEALLGPNGKILKGF